MDNNSITYNKKMASNVHKFRHNAMATVFELYIHHPDKDYSEQAAVESFRLIDILEQKLSYFIENSDVTRINNSAANETIRIGPDCTYCIEKAIEYKEQTFGVFEPCVGFLKKADIAVKRQNISINQKLVLIPEDYRIKILETPVYLDLGGIGKGYAVDKIRELLDEWDLKDFMIHGGFSSVLAVGNFPGIKGWQVNIREPKENKQIIKKVTLLNNSISSSGLQKGGHIFDPRRGQIITNDRSTWIIGGNAVMTECLSTAAMILSLTEIKKLISTFPGSSAFVLDKSSIKVHYFGV
jgi:FAD:protein FMN transferase